MPPRNQFEARILKAYRKAFPKDLRTNNQLKRAFIDEMVDKAEFARELENNKLSRSHINEILKVPIV